MAALGLHCCAQAFFSCGEWGLLFTAVRGLFIAVASLVVEHRLQAHGLQQLWYTGLVAPRHVGSSRTRAQTRVPCIGRRILNHCATTEVPDVDHFLKSLLNLLQYCFCFMFWFLATRHVGSQLLDQGSTRAPCTGRQSLNHWITREVADFIILLHRLERHVSFPFYN